MTNNFDVYVKGKLIWVVKGDSWWVFRRTSRDDMIVVGWSQQPTMGEIGWLAMQAAKDHLVKELLW